MPGFATILKSADWQRLALGRCPAPATPLGQHRHEEPGLLRRALRGLAHRPRYHQHHAARDPATVRGSRDRAAHPAGGRERGAPGHGATGGGRGGPRRCHPCAGGRRDRKVRQVLRGAAGRDREQTQGACRPGAARAFGGVPDRRWRCCPPGSTPSTLLRLPKRIWARDATVWKDDPDTPEIRDRLGWLTVGKAMAQQVKPLKAFADEVRAEFNRVVLCGMGGSSLAPEVLWRTFGAAPGHPSLHVLDSTDPTGRPAGGAGRRSGEDSLHRLEQVRDDPGERQLLPLFLGAHRRKRLAVRRDHRPWHSAGAARQRTPFPPEPSSIRPTSAAATRRFRSSAWSRQR